MLFDAHNHFHDARLDGLDRDATLRELVGLRVERMVVNGTGPEDWPHVEKLARAHPERVLPSYGVHPWKVMELSDNWETRLRRHLDAAEGRAGIGEIGLDRWIRNTDFDKQLEVFRRQWRLATERNLPATIHCLRAWGPLLQELRAGDRPARGFLVHSPGASPETIRELADLGAYFSVSGVFADARRPKYQRALEAIPTDRLLIETDAPDMLAPEEYRQARLCDPETNDPVTHPANLLGVYGFVATHLDEPIGILERRVAENFHRLFGRG